MKKRLILIILLTSISCAGQQSEKIKIIGIDIIENEVIGKNVQLIDIRTPGEYKAGYIDDAINIDFYDLGNFIIQFEKLDKTKPVYIYCHSGVRSRHASNKLIALGFTKIYDYKGGYKEWSKKQIKKE
ncbi:rhodanese-like domain-containing protein [Flavobacteriaceae bacterium R38]|nr:rhodanese-like domain-containing protein [Flavobacteriaceae bacterium R38]